MAACLQCRRVHISSVTLEHLKGSYKVEPGDGQTRDSYLKEHGVVTYLVINPKVRNYLFTHKKIPTKSTLQPAQSLRFFFSILSSSSKQEVSAFFVVFVLILDLILKQGKQFRLLQWDISHELLAMAIYLRSNLKKKKCFPPIFFFYYYCISTVFGFISAKNYEDNLFSTMDNVTF